jgi:hypothetical protein
MWAFGAARFVCLAGCGDDGSPVSNQIFFIR